MSASECPHCQTKFVVASQQPMSAPPATLTDRPATPSQEISQREVVHQPQKEDNLRETNEATRLENTQHQVKETPKQETLQDIIQATENEIPQPPQTDVPAAKASHFSSYLLIIATLAIIVGGVYYWNMKSREAIEEKAFMMLEGCTDKLNYEDFIARFPNSRHLDEVKSRFHALEHVDSLWGAICVRPTAEALEQFLSENPSSPHRTTALQKIDSIDWYTADIQGTVAAYDAYIVRHDNGEYITQAYAAREVARQRELRAQQDSIAAADSIAAVQG